MTYTVSHEKFVTCTCGLACKGRAGFATHARKCPVESRRSAMFIAALESNDWSAYNSEWHEERS